ncbi:MAG: replication initiation factor domain-containing protein [Phycisphaeraceae bacterium]|nr:replication initiation factor domain-containing protein [Phycisphaeraceae bacterium]
MNLSTDNQMNNSDENEQISTCPPSVIRGAKLHEAEIGIDWLRFTMPFNRLHQMTNKLAKYLGSHHSKPGMWGYRERYLFACGAFVTFTDASRECCVELTGDTCNQLGHDAVMEIMTWAYHQFARATRIDISLDFKGQSIGLIDNVIESCKRQELCRCRRWGTIDQHTASGECTGYTVNLGKRGKDGSGRFVRVYDKGLQSGEAAKGEWERWETEFANDAANQVCVKLVLSDNWPQTASELALGAVDFREQTGSRSLKRRLTAQWWARFTESINLVLVRIKHIPTNIDRYGTWLCKSVFPAIHTMAHHSGQPVMQVVQFFVGNQNLAKSVEAASPVVWAYMDMLQPV